MKSTAIVEVMEEEPVHGLDHTLAPSSAPRPAISSSHDFEVLALRIHVKDFAYILKHGTRMLNYDHSLEVLETWTLQVRLDDISVPWTCMHY